MKLSQPASSSDIEVAREIARRLTQHRRRDDRADVTPQPAASTDESLSPPKRLKPPPLPPRLAQPRPEPAEAAEPIERIEPPVVEIEEPLAPAEPEPKFAPAPARPSPARVEAAVRPAPPPRVELPEPADEFEAEFDPEEPPAFKRSSWDDVGEALDEAADAEVELSEPEDDEPLGALAAAPASPVFQAPAGDPALTPDDSGASLDVDAEDATISPEELVGGAETAEPSPFDQLAEAERSPFDDALLDEGPAAEEPVGPSWDEIVETCRLLCKANGAMLVDPAGQVFAARGDWPTPGPNAIATKLVAMMEKTLKDAPTRSISAPLMGLHLTAWRVQLSEGLITVAFIARTPVKTEARPGIDNEIHRGTGA
jgi:hypothetical protein